VLAVAEETELMTCQPRPTPRRCPPTEALVGLGFSRQLDREAWPPERPMLEGTYLRRRVLAELPCNSGHRPGSRANDRVPRSAPLRSRLAQY
jgi:hypothetical protein